MSTSINITMDIPANFVNGLPAMSLEFTLVDTSGLSSIGPLVESVNGVPMIWATLLNNHLTAINTSPPSAGDPVSDSHTEDPNLPPV